VPWVQPRRLLGRRGLALALAAALLLAAAVLHARRGPGDAALVVVGGRAVEAYVADTPGERGCGYYCYDAPAIAFLWPEGAPPEVAFTMRGLGFPVVLVHVRGCRVHNVTVMEPGGLYRVTGVEPGDWFLELRGRGYVPGRGERVWAPWCRG